GDAEGAGALADALAAGAELHQRRLVDGQGVDRGAAQGGAPRGRAQAEYHRLAGTGIGDERSGDVLGGLPDPENQRTRRDVAERDARNRGAVETERHGPGRYGDLDHLRGFDVVVLEVLADIESAVAIKGHIAGKVEPGDESADRLRGRHLVHEGGVVDAVR